MLCIGSELLLEAFLQSAVKLCIAEIGCERKLTATSRDASEVASTPAGTMQEEKHYPSGVPICCNAVRFWVHSQCKGTAGCACNSRASSIKWYTCPFPPGQVQVAQSVLGALQAVQAHASALLK